MSGRIDYGHEHEHEHESNDIPRSKLPKDIHRMNEPLPETAPGRAPKPSALRVATIRAAHQLLDRPLVFEDPLAVAILGPEEEAALRADPGRYNHPLLKSLRGSLVVRGRLAEDEWARSRARGVRQFVVLGAGLDTSAYRHGDDDGSRVFEVDLPATQAWKRERLRAAGIAEPPTLTYVPLDFETVSLDDALRAAGLRRDEPAFFSWLGVTMYLEDEAVTGTLCSIASLAPGSGVVFDYAVRPELLPLRERLGVQLVAAKTAEHGEPWKSFFDPAELGVRLRALGFGEVEDHDAEELNARYLAGRADGLRKSGVTRIICARV